MKTMRRSGFLATAALLVVLSQWPATARAQSGGGNGPYAPPACVAGVPFADVTCTTFYDAWIEQFARDGITSGCGSGNYCPNENVTERRAVGDQPLAAQDRARDLRPRLLAAADPCLCLAGGVGYRFDDDSVDGVR
jgi:hypothetical protein